VDVIEVAPGVRQVVIRHDPTCPWLAEFERDGGRNVWFTNPEDVL
jgi:hypothetical protein